MKKENKKNIRPNDDGLSADDLAFLEQLKNTDDPFGLRVNAIEAQVS